MRCTICEMHVDMIRAAAGKELGKVQGIACALFCLGHRPVSGLVVLDEIARPFAGSFRVPLKDFQNCLRWRIMNWRR